MTSLSLQLLRNRAEELMQLHGLVGWGFAFDRAKTRAGLCDYTRRRISVSSHYASQSSLDDFEQVMLHEIAHALVGKSGGHGLAWRKRATELGYRHQRIDGRALAMQSAPWLGRCPSGHEHFRYRRPASPTSCLLCAPVFTRRHLIDWSRRAL